MRTLVQRQNIPPHRQKFHPPPILPPVSETYPKRTMIKTALDHPDINTALDSTSTILRVRSSMLSTAAAISSGFAAPAGLATKARAQIKVSPSAPHQAAGS